MDVSDRVQLPAAFEGVDIDCLVLLIADMLQRLMAHNDRIPLLPESLTRFHSRTAPNISILDYLKRIVRFINVEKSCLLITLHYIDQICARIPLFTLSSLTCHRFVIASIVVSSKGLCDSFSKNSLYARVGGISVSELNMLEREFLRAIDWQLTCTREVLQEYYVNLVRTHSNGQFILFGAQYTRSTSSDSDMDSPPSPTSPLDRSEEIRQPSNLEASTILIDTATLTPEVSRRPTIEQNMAFADLQQSLGRMASEEVQDQ